ncbi:amino acid transporter [Mycetocola zhujimingii]|nr:amino acid transporter [Mycetocola zhujimingii]
MVRGNDVVALFRSFARAGISAWAAGGWAVDAAVGRQTREHGDLDLAVDARHLPTLLALLTGDGFATTVDWLPSRLELTAADGRRVDLHPVEFAPDGSGIQRGLADTSFVYTADGFTTGIVEGFTVPCLSVEQQLRFRDGYPPRQVDVHDIRILNDFKSER